MMFQEVPFLDRFEAAARAGFTAVEYLFPYEWEPRVLAQKLREYGLIQALFNLPAGDFAAGERGLAALPGREAEFLAGLERALAYAEALGNTRIHAMAGLVPEELDPVALEPIYKENIARAAARAAERGLTLLIGPINHRSMPGYLLRTQGRAARIIVEIGAANLKLQFDCFHCQMEEGAVSLPLREHFPITGHYQIAGVRERHEPDMGELNYAYFFRLMDDLGYDGFAGCGYIPAGDTAAGLAWMRTLTRGA